MRQIFIRSTNQHARHTAIFRCFGGRRGKGVIGFEVDHGPNGYAHCLQSHFENRKLRQQFRLYAFAGLVTGIQVVPEGFDDVIGGNANMRCARLDHHQHGVQHAAHRTDLQSIHVRGGGHSEVVPEQFVGAVD